MPAGLIIKINFLSIPSPSALTLLIKLLSTRSFATDSLILEYGNSTSFFRTKIALRILVNISAIGSAETIFTPYQLAFVTPGISPFDACSLNEILLNPNVRM